MMLTHVILETLPPDVLAALDRYDEEAFAGNTMADNYEWSDPQWRVVLWVDGDLAGQIGLYERDCRVGGQAITLGGIGGVMTRPEFRGQGVATFGMAKAVEYFREHRPIDFALLVCLPRLVEFYQGMGWQVVSGPIWVEHPQRGVVAMDEVTAMVMPLHDTVWPAGKIELMGWPW